METILKYFPNLTEKQRTQLTLLRGVYEEWNSKINVISRKDIGNLYEHHVLHSMAIAKFFPFKENTKVMDLGTGGGFPGIPLAILYPKCQFHLVDSIGKKIRVAEAVARAIDLHNVKLSHTRGEEVHDQYDFVVTRATMRIPELIKCVRKNTHNILALKGEEYYEAKDVRCEIYDLNEVFEGEFFETKKLIHIQC